MKSAGWLIILGQTLGLVRINIFLRHNTNKTCTCRSKVFVLRQNYKVVLSNEKETSSTFTSTTTSGKSTFRDTKTSTSMGKLNKDTLTYKNSIHTENNIHSLTNQKVHIEPRHFFPIMQIRQHTIFNKGKVQYNNSNTLITQYKDFSQREFKHSNKTEYLFKATHNQSQLALSKDSCAQTGEMRSETLGRINATSQPKKTIDISTSNRENRKVRNINQSSTNSSGNNNIHSP